MAQLEGLYAITPDWSDSARLLDVTGAILAGGCRLLQYRNKSATRAEQLQQASALRELTARQGTLLIINDDVELALASSADGAHLGTEDGDLALARQRLGPNRLLGASCYQSLELAKRALDAGADYVAFGSFFPSPTKPLAKRAQTNLLGALRSHSHCPVAAIGGITLTNAASLITAGADMLAVISAVYLADDPTKASHEFSQLFAQRSESPLFEDKQT